MGAFGTITLYNGTDWIGMGTGLSSLNGVWGTSGSNVYAVGYGGMILHYDGTSWTNISSVTNKGLRDVWGCSGGDVFAVGEDATILRYDGTSWAAMLSGANGFLGGVWGSSCNDVFAVGAGEWQSQRPHPALRWQQLERHGQRDTIPTQRHMGG